MKISILGTAYPYRGGLAAYNERLARQLMTEGHTVSVFTFTLQYPSFLFPGKTQYLSSPAPQGMDIRRKVNSINPFNWISVGNRIRREKPDLLIIKYWLPFMSPCFSTIARIARRNRHTRVISIFDNVIPHEKRTGDRLLTSYFTSSIDGAIAMSKSVLDDLLHFRREIPSELNPHPLFDNFGQSVERASALGKLGLSSNYRYLLFFGFIRAYKGLDLLIQAFADSRIRYRNVRLIVAGEFYEDDKPYRDKIKSFSLQDEVIMFDRFINDDEVAAFFGAADLVVQPYRDATQSGVTQIAYHFIKPMIVTDVGGLREIVPDGKCGYVVKPDPTDIANAIISFLENKTIDFEANIRAEREKYSWSRMTSSLLRIYEKTVNDDSSK